MLKVYLNTKSNPIVLETEPFASGGEGNIHKILSPNYGKFVVKVYHKSKRTTTKEQKIRYLLNNPPSAQNENGHNSLVWVKGMIYGDNGFLGLMMPYAKGDKLVILCSNKIPRKFASKWQRFSLKNSDAMKHRLGICFNIAAALYQVHSTGRYVLVDLKPDNVIIQPNGLVSIVDIDSMEIIENGRVLFPAAVTTPEFAPPEFYRGTQPGKKPIYNTWDLYSMSIIFYKLLFGIHPFAGSAKPPYDELNSLDEKIEHGLFVHHPEKSKFIRVLPPPHRRFTKVRQDIQDLFIQCFADGHVTVVRRPTADQWCSVISGKSLVKSKRELPSRVLNIDSLVYTKPRPLPVPSTRNINTGLQPKAVNLSPVLFNKNRRAEIGSIVAFGILSFAVLKVVMVSLLVSMGVLAIGYNFRREVIGKRGKKRRNNLVAGQLQLQEGVVSELRRLVSTYNLSFKGEIKELTDQQYQLLLQERQAIDERKHVYYKAIYEQDELLIALEEDEEAEIEALKEKYIGVKKEELQQKNNTKILQRDISTWERELKDILVLEQDQLNHKISSKDYLLHLGVQLDKISSEKKVAIRTAERSFDLLLMAANKEISTQLFKNETSLKISKVKKPYLENEALNEIHERMRQINQDKKANLEQIRKEYDEQKKVVLKEKQIILDQKRNLFSQKIKAAKSTLNQKNNKSTEIEAFEKAKNLIEEEYNQRYQKIIEIGEKLKKATIAVMKNEQEATKEKTEKLFSKSIIPIDAGSQYQNYEDEARKLVELKQEKAQAEGEVKSFEEINFWRYMELILTGK